MQDERLIKQVMEQVQKQMGDAPAPAVASLGSSMTEFVGTAKGDTIGLVIANVDEQLRAAWGIDAKYRSLGLLGARVGAGPQIMALDEAVKASNTELLVFELPRDTKGGGGHGSLAILGAEEVSDARRGIEIALGALDGWCFGDIYMNDSGHIELQYTARASYALAKYFKAPLGKAWGLSCGWGAIGIVMADTALKSANVEIVMDASPGHNTSFSNEYMIMISGDSGAVKQAIMAAREAGKKLLGTLGDEPESFGTPYIL